jgi:hypothetical protein
MFTLVRQGINIFGYFGTCWSSRVSDFEIAEQALWNRNDDFADLLARFDVAMCICDVL